MNRRKTGNGDSGSFNGQDFGHDEKKKSHPLEIKIDQLLKLDNTDQVKETIIYDFCKEFDRFSRYLNNELEMKYKKKDKTLEELLIS